MDGPPAAGAKGSYRAVVVCVLLAVGLGAVQLPFASFMADDLIQLGMFEGVSPRTGVGPLEVYTLVDGDPQQVLAMKNAGAFPWFFDPEMKMAFWRPLSSGLLAADHAVFGLHPHGYYLHSLAWFLLLVVGVGLLLRRSLPRRIATLAMSIFTLSGIHGMLFWTATRYSFVAAALGAWALLAHVRWREDGWRPGAVLSVLGYGAALAGGEGALAVLGYAVAYEGLRAPGSRGRRALCALPMVAVTVLYLLAYKGMGYGASSGSGYVDPFVEPLRFAVEFPGRALTLIGSMVIGGHTDVWLVPATRPAWAVIGVVSCLLMGVLLRRAWSRGGPVEGRAVRWLLAGSLLAVVPFTPSILGARNLVAPFIGGSAALALVLVHWWTVLRRRPGVGLRLLGVACWVLAVIHLAFAPLQRLGGAPMFKAMFVDGLAAAMAGAELDEEHIAGQRVVLVNPPDMVVGLHSYFYRQLYRMPMPQAWWALSWEMCDHRVTRTAADTFELELVDSVMAGRHLSQGQVIQLDGMRATVLELGEQGPHRVEFRFDRPLDDPSLVFLVWREGALRHVQLPPLGESLLLER